MTELIRDKSEANERHEIRDSTTEMKRKRSRNKNRPAEREGSPNSLLHSQQTEEVSLRKNISLTPLEKVLQNFSHKEWSIFDASKQKHEILRILSQWHSQPSIGGGGRDLFLTKNSGRSAKIRKTAIWGNCNGGVNQAPWQRHCHCSVSTWSLKINLPHVT